MKMDKNSFLNKGYFLNVDLSLIIALIIFTLSGFFLLPYYQYQINPDGIVYINILKPISTEI